MFCLMRSHLLLCYVTLVCSWSVSASPPTDVVVLNDSNFEHHTQAATGQTTGVWCVLFTSPKDRVSHQAAISAWEYLASDEDKEVIFAMIDLDSNKQVAQRFQGVKPPTAVLLKGRSMYTYAVPDSDDCHEHILGFVSGSYALLPRQEVPPESAGKFVSLGQDGWQLDEANTSRLKWALVLLAVGVLFKCFLYSTSASKGSGTKPKEVQGQPKAKRVRMEHAGKADETTAKAEHAVKEDGAKTKADKKVPASSISKPTRPSTGDSAGKQGKAKKET